MTIEKKLITTIKLESPIKCDQCRKDDIPIDKCFIDLGNKQAYCNKQCAFNYLRARSQESNYG